MIIDFVFLASAERVYACVCMCVCERERNKREIYGGRDSFLKKV